jgi:hypothetical protein
VRHRSLEGSRDVIGLLHALAVKAHGRGDGSEVRVLDVRSEERIVRRDKPAGRRGWKNLTSKE